MGIKDAIARFRQNPKPPLIYVSDRFPQDGRTDVVSIHGDNDTPFIMAATPVKNRRAIVVRKRKVPQTPFSGGRQSEISKVPFWNETYECAVNVFRFHAVIISIVSHN